MTSTDAAMMQLHAEMSSADAANRQRNHLAFFLLVVFVALILIRKKYSRKKKKKLQDFLNADVNDEEEDLFEGLILDGRVRVGNERNHFGNNTMLARNQAAAQTYLKFLESKFSDTQSFYIGILIFCIVCALFAIHALSLSGPPHSLNGSGNNWNDSVIPGIQPMDSLSGNKIIAGAASPQQTEDVNKLARRAEQLQIILLRNTTSGAAGPAQSLGVAQNSLGQSMPANSNALNIIDSRPLSRLDLPDASLWGFPGISLGEGKVTITSGSTDDSSSPGSKRISFADADDNTNSNSNTSVEVNGVKEQPSDDDVGFDEEKFTVAKEAGQDDDSPM